MTIVTVEIDVAKNVIAVHGEDEAGNPHWYARGATRQTAGTQCRSAVVPYRHASLLRSPPLGQGIYQVWPHTPFG